MSWVIGEEKGFDCRSTAIYVTDPTGCGYLLGNTSISDQYPQTRTIDGDSITYGISASSATSPSPLDRDSGAVDKRFSGSNYAVAGESFEVRVDLPFAGPYDFRVAIGDIGFDHSADRQILNVYDGSSGTPLLTINKATGPTLDHYYDASGTLLDQATWVSSNTAASLNFTSYARIVVGGVTAGATILTHFSLEPTSGAGPSAPVLSTITPSSAYANASVPSKLVGVAFTGTGLDGTSGAFDTISGFTFSSLSIAGGGASGTVDIQIATGKSPGSYNFTFTTAGGSSTGTSNTLAFTVSPPSGGVGGGADMRGGFEN